MDHLFIETDLYAKDDSFLLSEIPIQLNLNDKKYVFTLNYINIIFIDKNKMK